MGDLASAWSPWTAAFVGRMGELGWIKGLNIAIEYRWSEGRPEPIAGIAAEFVRQKVDMISAIVLQTAEELERQPMPSGANILPGGAERSFYRLRAPERF